MKEILLYGEVGWDFDARWLESALADADGRATIRVHSPGGDVFEGIAISNAIRRARRRGVRVTAIVDGIAASAASYMCLTADRVLAGPGSVFMIHPPSGRCWGTASDMRETARALDTCHEAILDLYSRRCPRPRDEIDAAMGETTWLTAGDAIEFGLADAMDEDDAPDLSAVDSKWAGLSGSGQYAAFACGREAMQATLRSYEEHSGLFRDRIEEAREFGIAPARDTCSTMSEADGDDCAGEAPDAGSGEAPRLFSDGWNVFSVDPKEG